MIATLCLTMCLSARLSVCLLVGQSVPTSFKETGLPKPQLAKLILFLWIILLLQHHNITSALQRKILNKQKSGKKKWKLTKPWTKRYELEFLIGYHRLRSGRKIILFRTLNINAYVILFSNSSSPLVFYLANMLKLSFFWFLLFKLIF